MVDYSKFDLDGDAAGGGAFTAFCFARCPIRLWSRSIAPTGDEITPLAHQQRDRAAGAGALERCVYCTPLRTSCRAARTDGARLTATSRSGCSAHVRPGRRTENSPTLTAYADKHGLANLVPRVVQRQRVFVRQLRCRNARRWSPRDETIRSDQAGCPAARLLAHSRRPASASLALAQMLADRRTGALADVPRPDWNGGLHFSRQGKARHATVHERRREPDRSLRLQTASWPAARPTFRSRRRRAVESVTGSPG